MSQSPTSRRKQRVLRSATAHITSDGLLQLLDIALDALLVIDQAGTITMVNEQTEALFDYARSQLLGQQLEILLPERFRAAYNAHREHYCSAPRTRQLDAGLQLSGKRKDGSKFPLDISLRPVLIDEALHVIASVRDMPAQQRIEEELAKRLEDEQQLQMLNTILSATTENVSLYDKHGRYRFVSEKTAKQLGLQQPVEQHSLRLHPAQLEEVLIISPSSDEPTPARMREPLAETANGTANDGQNNVVLAVDDNQDTIVLIKEAFKGTLYKIVGLTEPLQLMERIQELRPCAITLDVMMPTLNGWQMLHRLKDNPATAAIPVVMLTVLTEPTIGSVLGADDYVIKPFQPEALVSTLDRLVTSRKSLSQASKCETRL